MARPTQCFISYSHRDYAPCDRLLVHLKAVANRYGFPLWCDHERLRPGFQFNTKIAEAIDKSDIFIPLVTNDFFASDYILQHEGPAMLDRRKQHPNDILISPVIYQESCWRLYFGDYIQVAPMDHRRRVRPVARWRDREQGFAQAANEIADAIADWFGPP